LPEEALLKMSELAERSGVSSGTIKHYLREGLLGGREQIVRTSRNMAYYPENFVDRIRLIKRLQEERFLPLRLIKDVLDDDPDRANAVLDPVRGLGTVIADDVTLKPYPDVLVDAPAPPPGIGIFTRSAFAERASVPTVLGILAEVGATDTSPVIAVRSVGGAVSQVPDDATAYAHRQVLDLVDRYRPEVLWNDMGWPGAGRNNVTGV